MPSIYSYQKYITNEVTKVLKLPNDNQSAPLCTELATIDGITYVSVPDNIQLPADQPKEIANSIKQEEVTDSLRNLIKAHSPHCKLIADRVIEQIRARYSVDEEQYYARIGLGVALNIYEFQPGERDALLQFGNYVEQCRQWGRDQRGKLGF